ncbi:MAG: hypothetical protein LIP08_05215 [Bacteroides sp.]|nr:hypothetical protein [Bacteroides sp.]
MIEAKLKITLHDWNSYEPAEFRSLDSAFTSVFDDGLYIQSKAGYDAYMKEVNETMEEVEIYSGLSSYSSK